MTELAINKSLNQVDEHDNDVDKKETKKIDILESI